MRLLVCGGSGFIGTNFILSMLSTYKDIEIINYDKLTYAGNIVNLVAVENNPHYFFERGDITDATHLTKVIKKHKISHIINFAAETHVDRSIHQGSNEFVMTNVLGVQVLLDIVKNNKIKRFIQVSTDEVYGSLDLTDPSLFTEKSPFLPNTPYAATKAAGDLLCRSYFVTHHTPVIVTHSSNNYGPYQFPEKLIPYSISRLLKGKKIPLYGDGLNIRDWIHVKDHVIALDYILRKGILGEVYNIGSNTEVSNITIAQMLFNYMNKSKDQIEYIPDRPGHDRRYAIDSSKLMNLGWKPIYTKNKFKQGLIETVEWYLNHPEWLETIWTTKRREINHFQNKIYGKS